MADIVASGGIWEVDCFADAVVDIFLEGGLHQNVVFGANVHGRDEDFFSFCGDFFDVLEGAFFLDLFDDVVLVEADAF